MPDVAQLLQSLHPMREPPPPSPVAPFLVMLAAGVTLALVAFVAWRQLGRRRAGLRRSAELALASTRDLAPAERLAAQARLLRRLVRARSGESAAKAQGEGWLAALDDMFATTFFTRGAGVPIPTRSIGVAEPPMSNNSTARWPNSSAAWARRARSRRSTM